MFCEQDFVHTLNLAKDNVSLCSISFLLFYFFSLKTIFDLVYFIILEEKTRRLDLESSRK